MGPTEIIVIILVVAAFFLITRKAVSRESVRDSGYDFIDDLRKQKKIENAPWHVEDILDEFARMAPKKYSGFKAYILNEDDMNAAAVPGGHILVTRGLDSLYKGGFITKDELAGVIAHEIGHLSLGHSQKKMLQSMRAKYAGRVLLKNPITKAISNVALAHSSQEREFEADEYATRLLKRSPFETKGLLRFLEKTIDQTHFPHWKELFGEHPHTEARIERLKSVLKVMGRQ